MIAKIMSVAGVTLVSVAMLSCGPREGAAHIAPPPDRVVIFPIAYEDLAQSRPGAMLFIDQAGATVAEGSRRPGEMLLGVPRGVPMCRIPNGICFDDKKSMLPILVSEDISKVPIQFTDIGATVQRREGLLQPGCASFLLKMTDSSLRQTYTVCSGVGVTEIIVVDGVSTIHRYVLRSAYGISGPLGD